MTTFTESQMRQRARSKTGGFRDATTVLKEEVASANKMSSFDIFLSHSTSDAQIILGVKGILEDYGKTVYVDWLEDPQLNRRHVTAATAEAIRNRMHQCSSLIYVHSENSKSSKWMPWELGYFDGFSGAIAILPVTKNGESFTGQEYLGIYPYIDEAPRIRSPTKEIWINKGVNESRAWDTWLRNPRAFRKTG
ncbi:toll/interleukin-1 receptor domain-containing protein [Sulfitobacter sabulilitoris]|uniref:Toll/interleukin-1 receptor domain-containing protein n=1 Tax=Sulfitobacter sabulilitoris TaxID=2562655 RepID=A0A5S3P7B9_9RHOB|nr:toll/interleukin-1 receptor domain-containing protein [Sulfitobacter sabulilitoris]TMM49131.1 toll/interleukin-1 receptor domain-containing protein [Sulfitobacter sabulilitoris]